MNIEAARLAREATQEQVSLPEPKPRSECRWRRLADLYIEDWKTVCLRDPDAVGWGERSLLGKLIDGVFGGQTPEEREMELQERHRAIESGLTKLSRIGDGHLIIAFRVFHLNPAVSIAEQCRRFGIRERKYHEYRQQALEYLRWHIYELTNGQDREDKEPPDVAGDFDSDRALLGAVA